MIRIIIAISFWLCALMAAANSETTDSVKSRNLDEVVVEAQLQRTSATVSTYLPTKRQRSVAADWNLVGHPAITADVRIRTLRESEWRPFRSRARDA